MKLPFAFMGKLNVSGSSGVDYYHLSDDGQSA